MTKKYQATKCYDEAEFELIQSVDDLSSLGLGVLRQTTDLLPQSDANETLVFARMMETVKRKAYEKKYPQFKAKTLVPISSEAGIETEFLTYRFFDGVTLVALFENHMTEIPLVSSSAREASIKYHAYVNGWGYSLLDARRAARAGVALGEQDAAMARRGHEQHMDKSISFGVPSLRTFGLVNNPNAPIVSLPNGDWSVCTAAEKLADMNYMVTSMLDATKELFQGNKLLLSTLAYRSVATEYVSSSAPGLTILAAFKLQNPTVDVESWTVLDGQDAAGTGSRMIFYVAGDKEVMEYQVGALFEVLPAVQQGMMTTFPTVSTEAGLVLLHPLALSYGDLDV